MRLRSVLLQVYRIECSRMCYLYMCCLQPCCASAPSSRTCGLMSNWTSRRNLHVPGDNTETRLFLLRLCSVLTSPSLISLCPPLPSLPLLSTGTLDAPSRSRCTGIDDRVRSSEGIYQEGPIFLGHAGGISRVEDQERESY